MSNRKVIYVPAVDEPSFWGSGPLAMQDWGEWFKSNLTAYPGIAPSIFTMVPMMLVTHYFNQLADDLEGFDPENPPALFVEGTRVITLAWVMWAARRFDVSPAAAHKLGEDTRDENGVTVGTAYQFETWIKGFVNDFKPRAYITTVNRPNRQSKFRLNLTKDRKNIVVFSDSLTITRAATISVAFNEAVAEFGNREEFGKEDLLRLMMTLEMSSVPFQTNPYI